METLVAMMYHLEKVASVIHVPLYWAGPDGKILGANQAFLDVTGVHSVDDIRSKMPDDCFPASMAQALNQHVRLVVESRQSQVRDLELQDRRAGANRYFTATATPLLDTAGNVEGVVSTIVELTAARHAGNHTSEHAGGSTMRVLKNDDALTTLAHKVAHDIQSPLTAMSIMLNNCDELNEAKRLIFKSAFNSLKDIANNILNKYTANESVAPQEEQRCLILCSDFLLKLTSERKCQHQNLPVKFEMDITPTAQFAFIRVQSSQFGRAISNLINNAVDALKDTFGAKVTIRLDANDEFVTVQVKDNGKGMPAELVERIMNRQSFTAGKDNGHGLGMMQVWDMVGANEAGLAVTSQPGEGTTFELKFARTEKAEWVVDEIDIRYDDIIVILDDDQIIHDAWELRFRPFMQIHPELSIRHERNGQAALDYIASLDEKDKPRVHLLCDFELLNQDMNGLQVIKVCGTKRVLLVTSYYYMPTVQKSAIDLGVKILPKQMALVTPLFCTQRHGILKINVDHVVYDKNFYSIEQLMEKYGDRETHRATPSK